MTLADEKTEEPTQHRLREARKKGQVAKSNDITPALVFLGIFMYFSFQGRSLLYSMVNFIKGRIALAPELTLSIESFRGLLASVLIPVAGMLAPIFLVVLVTSVAGNVLQTGFMFSMEKITPKFDKINPVEGVKKIFSWKGLAELAKTILKVLVLVLVFRSYLLKKIDSIMVSGQLPMTGKFEFLLSIVGSLVFQVVLALVVLAGLDYGYQYYMFKKQMMMTKQELKEDMKSTDGDPFLKQRIRAQQKEFIKKRMLQGVKKSRVVLTNPTHYAVALKYHEEKDEAPIVVAKGQDHLAHQIKELAKKHNIPIYENPPLTRSIYHQVDLDEMIPPSMYRAVAEVIAFVEKLDYLKSGGGRLASSSPEEEII